MNICAKVLSLAFCAIGIIGCEEKVSLPINGANEETRVDDHIFSDSKFKTERLIIGDSRITIFTFGYNDQDDDGVGSIFTITEKLKDGKFVPVSQVFQIEGGPRVYHVDADENGSYEVFGIDDEL